MAHKFLTFVVCALLSVYLSRADDSDDEIPETVVSLDKATFDAFVKDKELVVAEFYAPWCGHCKQLAPEYEKAAQILKNEGVNVSLVKIDADQKSNKKLAKRFQVQGFPTLKVIRNGDQVEDYNGPRDADGIVQYVKKLAGPSSHLVTTINEAETFLSENNVLVVGFFSSLDSPEFASFFEATKELRNDYTFVHTTDTSLFPDKGVPISAPIIRIYKEFDEGFNDIKAFAKTELKGLLEAKTIPSVVEMNQDPKNRPHLEKVFGSPLSKALLFLDYSDEGVKAVLSESYAKVAKEGDHKLAFIIGNTKDNKHALEYFGVSEEGAPVLMIHEQSADLKYVKEGIKPEEIAKFVADFEAGKLSPRIKSEPIPASNDGPVTVVVRDNIEQVVFESKKNVLIEFYAPWCGHCKKLAPILDKVGEQFQNDPSVVIAKMDATANDVPKDKFNVEGFPTLYFVDAKGTFSLYEGGRTKKDLVSYINKHKVVIEASNPSEPAVEEPQKDEL